MKYDKWKERGVSCQVVKPEWVGSTEVLELYCDSLSKESAVQRDVREGVEGNVRAEVGGVRVLYITSFYYNYSSDISNISNINSSLYLFYFDYVFLSSNSSHNFLSCPYHITITYPCTS